MSSVNKWPATVWVDGEPREVMVVSTRDYEAVMRDYDITMRSLKWIVSGINESLWPHYMKAAADVDPSMKAVLELAHSQSDNSGGAES